MELVADIVIYRHVYTEDDDKNYVPRNPAQRKSVPEWSDGEIAIGSFRDICASFVYKSQGRHENREDHPTDICEVAIWVKASLTTGNPRSEYV